MLCIGLGLVIVSIGLASCDLVTQESDETPQAVPVRCPTPLYPSQVQPPSVPHYPGAMEVRIETETTNPDLATTRLPGTIAQVTKVESFTTSDEAAMVRSFYTNSLREDGWQLEGDHTGEELRFFWIVDTKPWEDPPCNATPE